MSGAPSPGGSGGSGVQAPPEAPPEAPAPAPGVSSPHDEWVRRALLSFPLRWREAHAEEFLEISRRTAERRSGLSSELSHSRPPIRDVADTVRSGLVVRYRSRPPLLDAVKYRTLGIPVPRSHLGWMRDDLRSPTLNLRFAGVRAASIPGTFLLASLALSDITAFEVILWLALALVTFCGSLAHAIRRPERSRAAEFRRKVTVAVGYDIVSIPEPPPIGFLPSEWAQSKTVAYPATRTAVAQWLPGLAFLSLGSGAALLVGAARPNKVTSLGPLRYLPDANSPMTASEVGLLALGTLGVASIAVTVLLVLYALRAGPGAAETIHPLNPSGGAGLGLLWKLALVPAILGSLLGISGAAPDLACAWVGAVLALFGGIGSALQLLARRFERSYGRPMTMGDLLVGERPGGLGVFRAFQRSLHSG